MPIQYKIFKLLLGAGIIIPTLLVSCSKDNPNKLPSVSVAEFGSKIEGFDSSGEVAPANLVAYWNFDGNQNETISGTAPTAASNVAYINNGVRGKGLALNNGYLYYASQIPNLGASLKSFTILGWVQILNNGSTPTQVFTLARPGQFWGNINLLLETGQHPASDTSDLVVHPDYWSGTGTQDNLNANWNPDGPNTYVSPTIGANKWVQIGVTYDSSSNTLQVWGNGRRIGTTSYQQRGTAYYSPTFPAEVIIGAWYNNIPGKQVTTDTWTVPMVGSVDEIRVYNTALGAADIKALYELGVAGK
jgi:hypothetical protein